MNVRVAMAVAVLAFGAVACGGAGDGGSETTAAESELRADRGKRLANASADDVIDRAVDLVRDQVATVSAGHPEITRVTAQNSYRFSQVGNVSYMEVGEVVDAILKSQSSVAPSSIVGRVRALVEPAVRAKVSGGVVKCGSEGDLGLLVYAACTQAEENNAFRRAKRPEGIDFDAIRSAWSETLDGSNLDNALVLPVAFANEPTLAQIRAAADIRVAYGSAAFQAIDDFTSANETSAAANPRAFAPIASALRGSGIKKRYFFAGGGDSYSRHYLVVVDEHNQVWGFVSGYSE